MLRQQAETDQIWRSSAGFMQFEKITIAAAPRAEIPLCLSAVEDTGTMSHPALVWVPENIAAICTNTTFRISAVTARGYVVIAPEYRGHRLRQAFYDAIDYGGAEVDDVVAAVEGLSAHYSEVDPARRHRRLEPWRHDRSCRFQEPNALQSGSGHGAGHQSLPSTRIKGVERRRLQIDPNNRFGGLPSEKPAVYRDRSPLFRGQASGPASGPFRGQRHGCDDRGGCSSWTP
jgi:hypothetical protein